MSYYYIVRGWFESDYATYYEATRHLEQEANIPGWAWYQSRVNSLSGCLFYGGDLSANQLDDLIGDIKTMAQKFPSLQGRFFFFGEHDDDCFSLTAEKGICTEQSEVKWGVIHVDLNTFSHED